MREIVFKNLTSQDRKRKDLFISETTLEKGVQTTTQRRSIYMIKGHAHYKNSMELNKFANEAQPQNNKNPRHIFILKKHDSKTKKDTFICDVVGTFYIVVNEDVYTIAFKHSFEVDFVEKSTMLPE